MLNLIVVNFKQKAALILALFLAGCVAFPEPGSLLVTPSPIPSEPPAATITAIPTSPQERPQAPQIENRSFCTVKTGTDEGTLHVRTGAGVEYQVIGYAHEGDILTILESVKGWHKVTAGDTLTGWVNSTFCN